MTSYIIIEDEEGPLELLHSLVTKHFPTLIYKGFAPSIRKAKPLIRTEKPELVFADIQLSDGNIFQLLEKLPIIDFKIIFVTAFDEFALKAFEFEALNYVLKPFDSEEIIKSVKRLSHDTRLEEKIANLSNLFERKSNRIGLSTTKGIIMVEINNLIHIEADRSYSTIYLKDGNKIIVSRPLGDIETRLPSDKFFRVHLSHIVNLDHIEFYNKEDGGQLTMINGGQVPVSRRKKRELTNLLLK